MSEFLKSYTEIEKILKENNVKKPFLCCGKSFQKTALFEYLKQFDIVVYDNIRPNPRFDDMLPASELFKSKGCDFMIAAGGGSPMDSAKMIRLMATNDVSKALSEPMENNDYKTLFIPTTSGTGSEATKISVFYINDVDKFSVHNLAFIPDYILFDEHLLDTLPLYQRKATCLDALCHSIESFWSTKADDNSKEYAAKSIRLFFENKEKYMNNEPEGNLGMLWASYYGGKAINLTGTTAAHALCYNITMNCSTSHGHSVAALQSKLWEYALENNKNVNDSRGRAYVLKTLDELGALMGGKSAKDGLRIFNSLLSEFDLPFPKADESRIDEFVSKVNVEKLKTHPTVLTADDVKEIYKRTVL